MKETGKICLTTICVLIVAMTFTACSRKSGDGAGEWGAAELIETRDTGSASSPRVAVDPKGNAVVVWQQSDGKSGNIWANGYTAGSGWGTAELIEPGKSGDAKIPQVAVDPNGNAVAVWQQSDDKRSNIWANSYTAGSGWGMPVLIETGNAGDAKTPQVAVDPNGNAVAVWYQYDRPRWNIWANSYTAGSGWGTAALIETNDTGIATSPQIAVDPNGNAVAVWQQSDGKRNNIWANSYTAGSGWGTPVLIETNNGGRHGSGNASSPQVAVDPKGNAVVVWQQFDRDGRRWNLWANRYTAGSGWGTAVLIETDNAGDAKTSGVAVDPNGNAVVVWQQSDGKRSNIWANRYTVGSGWGTAALIETDNAGDAKTPQVAVDPNGNAIAVWQQSDDKRNNIWANRYAVGSGWGTATLIERDNAGDATSPRVTVDPKGNAVAVWQQSDGVRSNIWANRYLLN